MLHRFDSLELKIIFCHLLPVPTIVFPDRLNFGDRGSVLFMNASLVPTAVSATFFINFLCPLNS